MKPYSLLILILLFFVACKNSSEERNHHYTKSKETVREIPNKTILKKELVYNNKNSIWSFKNKAYSGYAISKYENDSLMQKMGILNGRKHNVCLDWYPNGRIKSIINYKQGRLNGLKRIWTHDETHTLIAQLNYKNGRAEGEQKKWYPTGELFQVLHMKNGREEGIQKAYRKNGDLYANYEAKNGRIFGMKKAALCFGLEDQKVKNEE